MVTAVAESVAAVAALGALFAAIVAARHTKTLLDTEARRDDRAEDERKRGVARRISAWVAVAARPPERSDDGDDPAKPVFGVIICNSSDEVVYDVRVDAVGAGGRELPPIALTMVPPGTYFIAEKAGPYGWDFASGTSRYGEDVRPVTKSKDRRIASLTFRDASNLRWVRTESGLLEPT